MGIKGPMAPPRAPKLGDLMWFAWTPILLTDIERGASESNGASASNLQHVPSQPLPFLMIKPLAKDVELGWTSQNPWELGG